ncbi:MAG: ABC transporter substrate-binding protein [Acidobacteria bacterium]|nr:ABC transporter substrate-binding protein [Acidobacteriota bacterium]
MSLLMLCMLLQDLVPITYAAGYVPNVQFTPFYVAMTKGYYREEGIELNMDYTVGPDVLKLTAMGKFHFASADPDAFLRAVSQGMELTHVATLYQTYPIAFIARDDILTQDGLRGRRIGISGLYGSSYLGCKALLSQLALNLSDVQLIAIGFTQVHALEAKSVDAIVGYINHEPIRLIQRNIEVHTLLLEGTSRLPGVGIMAPSELVRQKPQLVRGFLKATFRGVVDVIQNPDSALAAVTGTHLTELTSEEQIEAEAMILRETVRFLKASESSKLGQCPSAYWDQLVELLTSTEGPVIKSWQPYVDRSFTWVDGN